jgi:hypothetical protein
MTLQRPGQKWIRDVNVEDFDSQVLSVSQQGRFSGAQLLSRVRHFVEQRGSV